MRQKVLIGAGIAVGVVVVIGLLVFIAQRGLPFGGKAQQLLSQASRAQQQGNLADAQAHLEELIATFPDSPLADDALLKLGEVYEGQQQLVEARRVYEADLAGAQGGDLSAIGRVQGSSNAYLTMARGLFASSSSYVDIFKGVTDALAGVAGVPDYNERMLGIQTTNGETLMSIQKILIQIRDNAPAHAEEVADATVDSGAMIANAIESGSQQLGAR